MYSNKKKQNKKYADRASRFLAGLLFLVFEVNLQPQPKLIQAELQKIRRVFCVTLGKIGIFSGLKTVPQLYVNKKFVGNFDTGGRAIA